MSTDATLTAADRLLLRAVFAWARANGWKRTHDAAECLDTSLREWTWYRPRDQHAVFVECSTFTHSPTDWRMCAADQTGVEGVELRADGQLNVARCVDILAALGVLPPELSSLWQAGRAAAYDREEWRVMHTHNWVGDEYAAGPRPWSVWSEEQGAREDLADMRHGRAGDAWLEHRRVGASEWERVD